MSVTVTTTWGRTAPLGSVICPVMLPREFWARAQALTSSRNRMAIRFIRTPVREKVEQSQKRGHTIKKKSEGCQLQMKVKSGCVEVVKISFALVILSAGGIGGARLHFLRFAAGRRVAGGRRCGWVRLFRGALQCGRLTQGWL